MFLSEYSEITTSKPVIGDSPEKCEHCVAVVLLKHYSVFFFFVFEHLAWPTQPQRLQWLQVQGHLLDGKLVRKPV